MMAVSGHALAGASSRFTYEKSTASKPVREPGNGHRVPTWSYKTSGRRLPECNRLALTATPASAVAGRRYRRRRPEHPLRARNLWPSGKKTLTGRLAPAGAGGARVGSVATGARTLRGTSGASPAFSRVLYQISGSVAHLGWQRQPCWADGAAKPAHGRGVYPARYPADQIP